MLLATLGPIAIADSGKPRAAFSFIFENDNLTTSDDSDYTGGLGVTYETDDLDKYAADRWMNRRTKWRSRLPGFAEGRTERLALSFGTLAFTPKDIDTTEPLPEQHPYAGILAFDTFLTSRSDDDQHAYKLRLGWVGPSNGVYKLVNEVHRSDRSPVPRGWDNQLPNEPVLNASYNYSWRMRPGRYNDGFSWDLTPSVGVSAGNYFSGASVSFMLRAGTRIANVFGVRSLDGDSPVRIPSIDGWRFEASIGITGYLIGHYMPIDGTAFRDSISAERRDYAGVGTIGTSLIGRSMQFDLVYTYWSKVLEHPLARSRYTGLNITWFTDD